MDAKLTSRAVEKAVDISGSYLRKLVRAGVIAPEKDSSGRFIYSPADIRRLIQYRAEILKRRLQREEVAQ